MGNTSLGIRIDHAAQTPAPTAGAASVVHVVYAATGAVALAIAGQRAITLHPADAFVFHPRSIADPLGVQVGLRGLEAHAEVVVATLVFGSDDPALEAGYRAMAADEEREAEALEWAEATIGDVTNATR